MKDEFNQYAEEYQQHIKNSVKFLKINHSYIIDYKINKILNVINKNFDSSLIKVLDVGCGIGLGHEKIKNKVKSFYGIDTSSKSIEIAKKNNAAINYKDYDGEKMPFDDNEIDVVYSMSTMHHVPKDKWQLFLNETYRILKKDGKLIIIDHNPLNPVIQWIVRTNAMDKNAKMLWPLTLRKMLIKSKFHKIKSEYLYFLPTNYKILKNLEEYLLKKIPLGGQYFFTCKK